MENKIDAKLPDEHPWNLEPADFIRWAVDNQASANRHLAREQRWESPLWQLVRGCKSYFEGRFNPEDFNSEGVFECVEYCVNKWGGWGVICASDASGFDAETAYAEFMRTWDKVRINVGETLLSAALKQAELYPLKTQRATKRPMPKYERFVSFALWTLALRGKQRSWLPCRAVAEALHTSPRMVGFWRDFAVADGILKVTEKHRARKATEFSVGDNLPEALAPSNPANFSELTDTLPMGTQDV